jgi:hypothetical protein
MASTPTPLAMAWHGAGLLALVLVDRAGHGALEEEHLHPVLELPDQHHLPVQAEQPARIV